MTIQGALAEWLRSGLQNRVHRFNSGRHLHFLCSLISFYKSLCFSEIQRTQKILAVTPGSGFTEVEGAELDVPSGYDLATQRIEYPRNLSP